MNVIIASLKDIVRLLKDIKNSNEQILKQLEGME